MKKSLVFFITSVIFLLFSCSVPSEDYPGNIFPTENEPQEFSKTPTLTANPTKNTDMDPTDEPIVIPDSDNTPAPTVSPQQIHIENIMSDYGYTDNYYLTDDYWEMMSARIDKYGLAKNIVPLEYHGNDYSMYNGQYSMDPKTFFEQIEWLMQNDYHFVTIHELRGFVEGWLELPARSIILTTDSGYSSTISIPSMIEQFQTLESIYGYRPHMQSYIWTWKMEEAENITCKDNLCWKVFNDALDSGFFTFGTHSEAHLEFGKMNSETIFSDLSTSIAEIEENLGIKVTAIAWPHESCPRDMQPVLNTGITIGFGGLSKRTEDAFVEESDMNPLCLPRLFPPNSGSRFSSRPVGITLEELLLSAIEH